jgi:glycine cleavage system regulatory protein
MRVDFVLTIIGQDRPGLVELVSRTVTGHGGNWEASRMARMSGRFAGILQVSVEDDHAEPLAAALRALDGKGLRVVVERAAATAGVAPATGGAGQLLRIELVGNDRPGVIRDVSSALADRGINVEELETECQSAPMSGGNLLRVAAEVSVPRELGADGLRHLLEARAPDFMVDVGPVGDPDAPA